LLIFCWKSDTKPGILSTAYLADNQQYFGNGVHENRKNGALFGVYAYLSN
jgi:hypothetical protein